jgi:hypothetical protein
LGKTRLGYKKGKDENKKRYPIIFLEHGGLF